jgi:hypothetical protein
MTDPRSDESQAFHDQIDRALQEGLHHGFARITIDVEVIKRGTSQVTVAASKSYRYHLPHPDVKS